MDYTNDFCCICLFKHEDLTELGFICADQITYFKKLTLSIPEMSFEEMSDTRLICKECCVSIENMHKFREKCLKSKNLLIDYVVHLRSVNSFIGNLTSHENHTHKPPDIKEEIDDAKKNLENFGVSFVQTEKDSAVKEEIDEEELMEDIEEVIVKIEHSYEDNDVEIIDEDSEIIEIPVSNMDSVVEASLNQSDKSYTCEYCRKVFVWSDMFRKHLQLHLNLPHRCSLCEEGFRDQNSLHSHLKQHQDETVYTCHACNKRFRTLPNFKRHFRVVHIGERSHECSVCHKKFGSPKTLEDHKRVHKGDYWFVCYVCNKRFRNTTALKMHLQKHEENSTEEGAYVPYDGFEQAIPAATAPQEVPRGTNPRVSPLSPVPQQAHGGPTCPQCGKTFRFSSHLRRHQLVHSGQRPHVCPQCSRGFSQRSTLRRHLDCHARGTVPPGGLGGSLGVGCRPSTPRRKNLGRSGRSQEAWLLRGRGLEAWLMSGRG